MEDQQSFKSRLDKVFGSLGSAPSSSLWSTADGEIERRLWRRCADSSSARDEAPCSSSFYGVCKAQKNRRRSFGDDDLEEEEEGPDGIHDEEEGEEESDIRSSIGLDPTLDFEEEEDEFDKVASGIESSNYRMYMRDVTEHGSFLNSENVLRCHTKDPRANHLAAKFRLKQDETEAQNKNQNLDVGSTKSEESRPRPILKRKDHEAVSKSGKRVRFNVEESFDEPGKNSSVNGPKVEESKTVFGVPDYLVNPSKYTRYSLDSTCDLDEASNARACGDFMRLVNSLGSEEAPGPVKFVPRNKKASGRVLLCREGVGIGIASGEIDCVSEENDIGETAEVANSSSNFRRYRRMSNSD